MPMTSDTTDFRRIRQIDGAQDQGFEEFCCQIARRDDRVAPGSQFVRLRGAGGDGGVEGYWRLPSGKEWGWQAKFVFELRKDQFEHSFTTALEIHPELAHYTLCLPFDLTGPTGRQKGSTSRSQFEKLSDWITEWTAGAKAKGRDVVIDYLGRSQLLDRFVAFDETGGRRSFWFDDLALPPTWFTQHLSGAIKHAGPRYAPDLSLKTDVLNAFEAFGRTESWAVAAETRLRPLREEARSWAHIVERMIEEGEEGNIPPSIALDARTLAQSIEQILLDMSSHHRDPDPTHIDRVRSMLANTLGLARSCQVALTADFEARHGAGRADSVSYRQFMAEFQGEFPAHSLDTCKDLATAIEQLIQWAGGVEVELPCAPAMLLIGARGMGKTHAICDAAASRIERGLATIVLFGDQFHDGEPWDQARRLLGVPATVSRNALLAAIDCAGEAAGRPAIIFIDALNESSPRSIWRAHLGDVIHAISAFRSVRLCISCRTSYLDDVLPEGLTLPRIEHVGFASLEQDAIFAFFEHYGIQPPGVPLFHAEYASPLFLKLVCESLQAEGLHEFPTALLGITEVADRFIDSKNARIARALNYDPREHHVDAALRLLIAELHRLQRQSLPLATARDLVRKVWSARTINDDLLAHLVAEDLLIEDRELGGDERWSDVVRFSFERIGDHLLAGAFLAELDESTIVTAFAAAGPLHFTVSSASALAQHRGLLEALAVLIPERYGQELVDVANMKEHETELLRLTMESLAWRRSDFVPDRLERLATRALARVGYDATEALLAVGTRPGLVVNANWWDRFLRRWSLAERDSRWCSFLHQSFGSRKSLDRILNWSLRGDLRGLQGAVVDLWGLQLAWCCAAADRRVRDAASKGLVRLLEAHPAHGATLIRRFADLDDDYVIERSLYAIYGAFIRREDTKGLPDVAEAVNEAIFATPSHNAMIRDFGRLILEFALERCALPATVHIARARPPYPSPWPLEWPSEEWAESLKDSYQRLPKLYMSCMDDDFARYTLKGALSNFEGLDTQAAKRWVLKHVLDLGYEHSGCEGYDGHMLNTYGPGRSKPQWAERIGKKYQWIALYRLMGLAADHLSWKPWGDRDRPATTLPDLQAERERNSDPTNLLKRSKAVDKNAWWTPVLYDPAPGRGTSDLEWLRLDDWPDSARLLQMKDAAGHEWILLKTLVDWSSRNPGEWDSNPYRRLWMMLHAYFVPKRAAAATWNWLQTQSFMGGWMPEGTEHYGGFLGEYPWAVPFRNSLERAALELSFREIPHQMFPTWADLSLSHQFDAFREETIHVTVPAGRFFQTEDLTWDKLAGYRDAAGSPAFLDPSVFEPGPRALLVRPAWLLDFLAKNRLELMWTVLSEKNVIGDDAVHRTFSWPELSRAHRLTGRGITSSAPLLKRALAIDESADDTG